MTELRADVSSTKLRSCGLFFLSASAPPLHAPSETLSDDDFASTGTFPEEDFPTSPGDFARFASSDSSAWPPTVSDVRSTSLGSSELSQPFNGDRSALSAEAPASASRDTSPLFAPSETLSVDDFASTGTFPEEDFPTSP